jgi:hypothetical protein
MLDHARGSIRRSHYIEQIIEQHATALKATLDCEVKPEPVIIKPEPIEEVFNDERDVA